MTETSRVGGTDLRLRRRDLTVVFLQLLEQVLNVEDVSGGIRVEGNDVVEAGGHVGRTFDDVVDDSD